jgi:Fur family ferric uptake transcriptional regulator
MSSNGRADSQAEATKTASGNLAVPGQRATKQRAALADLLARTGDFRTAQQLHDALKEEGRRVGLTTVYRSLQALADAGDVDVRRTDDGEALYRLCADRGTHTHHFHLVCRSCGTDVELDNPDMDKWAHDLAQQHGYRDVSHTIEIFGLCAACAGSD